MLGQRLHNFAIMRLLGEGGMSSVYEAEHALIRRKVAVKVLKSELSVDGAQVQRFFNEARATSAIRHPNIVEVIDVGRLADGVPYLVMELLEGESLGERLERVGPLDVPAALDIVHQAASALVAAHALRIVHRDLKPDNLFIVPDERIADRELVKVLDFGIAKLRGDLAAPPFDTMVGAVLGTPPYMSPEQCRGLPEEIDDRTDIYALGIILYEMLCGQPPFMAEGAGELMMMHMTAEPEPPSKYNRNISPELESVILCALSKRREDRFETMAEFDVTLMQIAETYGVIEPYALRRVPAAIGGGAAVAAVRSSSTPSFASDATLHALPAAVSPVDVQREQAVTRALSRRHEDGAESGVVAVGLHDIAPEQANAGESESSEPPVDAESDFDVEQTDEVAWAGDVDDARRRSSGANAALVRASRSPHGAAESDALPKGANTSAAGARASRPNAATAIGVSPSGANANAGSARASRANGAADGEAGLTGANANAVSGRASRANGAADGEAVLTGANANAVSGRASRANGGAGGDAALTGANANAASARASRASNWVPDDAGGPKGGPAGASLRSNVMPGDGLAGAGWRSGETSHDDDHPADERSRTNVEALAAQHALVPGAFRESDQAESDQQLMAANRPLHSRARAALGGVILGIAAAVGILSVSRPAGRHETATLAARRSPVDTASASQTREGAQLTAAGPASAEPAQGAQLTAAGPASAESAQGAFAGSAQGAQPASAELEQGAQRTTETPGSVQGGATAQQRAATSRSVRGAHGQPLADARDSNGPYTTARTRASAPGSAEVSTPADAQSSSGPYTTERSRSSASGSAEASAPADVQRPSATPSTAAAARLSESHAAGSTSGSSALGAAAASPPSASAPGTNRAASRGSDKPHSGAASKPSAAARKASAPAPSPRSAALTMNDFEAETAAADSAAKRASASPPSAAAASQASQAEEGYLSLDSAPWSDVFLGADRLGTTPLIRVPLPAGKYLLTLRNPELGTSTSYAVEIVAGKTVSRLVGWDHR